MNKEKIAIRIERIPDWPERLGGGYRMFVNDVEITQVLTGFTFSSHVDLPDSLELSLIPHRVDLPYELLLSSVTSVQDE